MTDENEATQEVIKGRPKGRRPMMKPKVDRRHLAPFTFEITFWYVDDDGQVNEATTTTEAPDIDTVFRSAGRVIRPIIPTLIPASIDPMTYLVVGINLISGNEVIREFVDKMDYKGRKEHKKKQEEKAKQEGGPETL
jgi:hypothetical protein